MPDWVPISKSLIDAHRAYCSLKKLLAVRDILLIPRGYSSMDFLRYSLLVLRPSWFSLPGISMRTSSAEGLSLGFLAKHLLIMPCKAEL